MDSHEFQHFINFKCAQRKHFSYTTLLDSCSYTFFRYSPVSMSVDEGTTSERLYFTGGHNNAFNQDGFLDNVAYYDGTNFK
jgi:hypothetical protein